MTIRDIYEQVLLDVPNIEMRNFIKRYNEVIDILATNYDTANAPKTDYIDAIDSEQIWYDLPIDCKGVIRVTAENGRELKSYLCNSGKIKLGITGSFQIEYIGTPTKLIKLEDTPIQTGINNSYHIAIVKYILAHEIPDRFQVYMQMYEELASQADKRLRSVKRKNIRIAAPKWR